MPAATPQPGARCPHCSYEAGPGLPEDVCPECGQPLFSDPTLVRWRRLKALSRRWAPLITLTFVVVTAGCFALCARSGMPWYLAALIAAYTAGYLAIGVWCHWGYVVVPILLSVACGSPWTLLASAGGSMWALAFLFLIALPAMIGFLIGRSLRLLLWWLDSVEQMHRSG